MGVTARILGALVLIASVLGSSFLAVVVTGGDSAFCCVSRWVYAPWLVAVALSLVAIGALAVSGGYVAWSLTAASVVAFGLTVIVWSNAV